jgi:microcystin-dependent protein
MSGVESVTLSVQQIPGHGHPVLGTSSSASGQNPDSSLLAATQAQTYYNTADNLSPMSPLSVGPAGGSQPHENLQPYACINFIISLFGIYPSQS